MTTRTDDWVSDVYWYEIIKNILSENKGNYLFAIEIWEKMKDTYGYSYDKNRVEKELLNLKRTGYAVSVNRRGKQAWMVPSSEKLLRLERNKKIDSAIAKFLSASNQMPTVEEILSKIDEPLDRQNVSERIAKIAKLTVTIDEKIKKRCERRPSEKEGEKRQTKERISIWPGEERNTLFYNLLITDLDGAIGTIDILTIAKIIDARKKFYEKVNKTCYL